MRLQGRQLKRCLSCDCEFEADTWKCPQCSWSPEVLDDCLAFAREAASQNGGFAPQYFEGLAKLETGHFWFESRNALVVWVLERYFPTARNFLEIGCGTGFVLAGIRQSLPRLKLSGSEMFLEGIDFANTRVRDIDIFQMDARKIPFRAEFDVIGAFDVLEHIDQDQTVLEQMHSAVKPGGGIIITVPQHRWLWSIVDEYSFHRRRYRRMDLLKKVKAAGFQVVRVTSFVSFLLPLLFMSRSRHKRQIGDFDPYAVYRISSPVNRLLTETLAVERKFIQMGVSWPAGGSLLLVAYRAVVR